MVVAAAAWINFPKRVPVFAKPHDGSSILNLSSALQTVSTVLSLVINAPLVPHQTWKAIASAGLAIIGLLRRAGRKAFGPFRDGIGRSSLRGSRMSFQRRQLNRKIADGGAFHGTKNHFETGEIGGKAVEQSVLATAANNKQALQLFSSDPTNRMEHFCITSGHVAKNQICDLRNLVVFECKGWLAQPSQLCVDLADGISGEHELRIVNIDQGCGNGQ